MKKILVLGASGDIGKYFIEYFLENYKGDEYEIIASGKSKIDYFDKLNVRYIQMDITQKGDFEKLPKDIYAIVDLAGYMPARMEGYNPYKYIDVNIIGNLNVLEFCRLNNVDRILFSQSFGDIKDHAKIQPLLTVDMPRNFSFSSDHTVYVLTKNFAVDLCKNYHEMYGIKTFIFRLPTIYLWSNIDHFYVDGVKKKIGYRTLIDNAIAGSTIEVWGNPNRVKDMVYVKDFCQMLFKALFVNREQGYYNVGTGKGVSLVNQIKTIIEVFCDKDKISKLIFVPDKPDAPQYVMDITPAVNELDYHPLYNWKTALEDMKLERQKMMKGQEKD